MCRISLAEGCRASGGVGSDVTTLAATVEVGFNPNVAMSSKSVCPVAPQRTIAAGVILNPPSAPIASTMMRKLSTKSSLRVAA
jgi:hypothetical protein